MPLRAGARMQARKRVVEGRECSSLRLRGAGERAAGRGRARPVRPVPMRPSGEAVRVEREQKLTATQL